MQRNGSFRFFQDGNKRNTFVIINTTIVCLISLLVLAGWFLHLDFLTRITEEFAPMQPLTALGLFMCAFSLRLFRGQVSKWKYVLIAIPLLIGVITLTEYAFKINLGIDLLLFKRSMLLQHELPGRLAPITAICFWLFAQSLIISQSRKRSPIIWAGVIATILTSIAFVAILSYFIKMETSYGWGSFTRMALHTSVCFVLLGISLLLYITKRLETLKVTGFNWAVILLGVTLLTACINFSVGLNNTENQNIKVATNNAAEGSKVFISSKLNEITLSLSRFAGRIEIQPYMPADALITDGQQQLFHESSYTAIALIKKGETIWRADNSSGEAISNEELVALQQKQGNIENSRSYLISTLDSTHIYIIIPVVKTLPTNNQSYVIGIINIKQLIINTFINPSYNNTFYIGVTHNKTLIYENSPKDSSILSWSQSIVYQENNIVLNITSSPTKKTISNYKSLLPNIAFEAGIILTALAMLLAYSIQNLFFHNKHISSLNLNLTDEIEARKTTEEILKNEIDERIQIEERLEEALKELKRSNYDLERFAYAVSHDLKGPLKGIGQIVDWLVADVGATNPDTIESFSLIQSRLAMLHTLIDGLLEYSGVGKKNTKRELLSLHTVVNQVIQSLTVPEHIKISINKTLPEIMANQSLMVQLFQNLISNAIKYNDKKEGLITISSRKHSDFNEIIIEDNGRGIAAEFHETAFLLFKKLESRDDVEGSGIGLATVKRIVEEYNGSIRIESEVGKYTRFIISLPKSV